MITVTCKRCNGTGKYKNFDDCVPCRGNGVLDEERLINLRDDYWSKKYNAGKISEVVYDARIAEINESLRQIKKASSVQPAEYVLEDDDSEGLRLIKAGITSSIRTVRNAFSEQFGGKWEVVVRRRT